MGPPEPLGAQHQLEGFDCGNAALNRWLQQRALANERQGVSRTVVLCSDDGNDVIAYVCLSAGASVLAEVPGALRRNRPAPLPVVVLGRALVADALRRSLAARRLIGASRSPRIKPEEPRALIQPEGGAPRIWWCCCDWLWSQARHPPMRPSELSWA
jgi:hypothetical protein